MTVEVYVSLNGLDYERLDLMKSESILMKYIYKDTQDLSKIYAPYSQPFALQGSLNNQRILGFLGETKIIKSKTNNNFDCKIYNNGLLAKKGLLKVTEARYEKGKIKSFTANFTTGLLSLKDRMGEDKISDLGAGLFTIEWDSRSVKNYLQNISNFIESTGFGGESTQMIVPLASNNRVWQVADINDPNKLDNISYNPVGSVNGDNFIKVNELAPAIEFRSIVNLIKDKYDLDIVMPLEDTFPYISMYVWCNRLEGSFNNDVYYDVINGFSTTWSRFNDSTYVMTADRFTEELTITRTVNPSVDALTLFFNVAFFGVQNTRSNENIELSIEIIGLDGVPYGEATNTVSNGGNTTNLSIVVPTSRFNVNNEFKFKCKVKSNFPITWTSSNIEIYYIARITAIGSIDSFIVRKSTNDNSSTMKMNAIDLYKSLPDLKVIDFLTSFFKTFNISVFETAPDDGRLYWLTPDDIKAQNKEYSKTEIDYTDYVTEDKVTKKIANDFNYYNFKHKTSKYKGNADYLRLYGNEYGQLVYPAIKPTKDLSEFKVETNFTIVDNVNIKGIEIPTFYGFTNETPTVQSNNALRYKPNAEDFTLFYADKFAAPQNPNLGYLDVAPNGTKAITILTRFPLVSSVYTQSGGASLGFGLIGANTTKSLYESYYREQTERLLEPNTLQSTFTLELPPNELVLNYANTNQGESNIPSGFRLQNDIVIGETRYSIIDATIDQTTGKTTLNLLNYV